MKKKICLLLLLLITLSFTSCKYAITDKKLIKSSKENKFYYTNMLMENINEESNYNCSLMDTNFHKEIILNSSNTSALNNFLKSLNEKHFLSKPKQNLEEAKYKIYITFKNNKYVINVYDEKLIGIHPWDGYYDMDYIDMTNTPISYNLYKLCSYMIPR